MSESLIDEAKRVAGLYRKVGHKHGIEDLLERMISAIEDAEAAVEERENAFQNAVAVANAEKARRVTLEETLL